MKNINKLLITLSVASLAVMGFAACKPDTPTPPAHEHTYTDWDCNATHHWRTVVCDQNEAAHEVQDGYATHTNADGVCTVCSYSQAEEKRVELVYKSATSGYSVYATPYGKSKATLTVPEQYN